MAKLSLVTKNTDKGHFGRLYGASSGRKELSVWRLADDARGHVSLAGNVRIQQRADLLSGNEIMSLSGRFTPIQ